MVGGLGRINSKRLEKRRRGAGAEVVVIVVENPKAESGLGQRRRS